MLAGKRFSDILLAVLLTTAVLLSCGKHLWHTAQDSIVNEWCMTAGFGSGHMDEDTRLFVCENWITFDLREIPGDAKE